jgi:hypothetical protein
MTLDMFTEIPLSAEFFTAPFIVPSKHPLKTEGI